VDFELAISVHKSFSLSFAAGNQPIDSGACEVRFDLPDDVPAAATATAVGTDGDERKREYDNCQADAQ
jgi:hypothetical protein